MKAWYWFVILVFQWTKNVKISLPHSWFVPLILIFQRLVFLHNNKLQWYKGKKFQTGFFLKANRFFVNIFWSMCRMVTIFWLTQRTRLRGPFRYLEHVRQANRKFSRGLWKKVSAQKMGFCQNIPTRFWASSLLIFWVETFFSDASRQFFIGLTNMFKVSERST